MKNLDALTSTASTIIFCTLLALKVSGPLDYLSWWWVCAPFWVPLAIITAAFSLAYLSLLVVTAFGVKRK